MKAIALAAALFIGAASGAQYNEYSKAILADKYISTSDEYLYEARCDTGKFKKVCDFSASTTEDDC
jgi:hypothetical protein